MDRICFLLLALMPMMTLASLDCGSGTRLHEFVCMPADYDKTGLPNLTQTPVRVEFWNMDIKKVDDMKQEIHIVMDMASFWKEPRLDVQFTAEEIAANAQHSLAREMEAIIWKPDLYIYNLTHFESFAVLDKLSGLSVYPDKTVRYYINVEIKVSCAMWFGEYPVDSQLCYFTIGSSNYRIEQMPFSTNKFNGEQYHNQEHRIFTRDFEESEKVFKGQSGDYSLVGFRIQIVRYAFPFFLKNFLPVMGIVGVSWASFLIPPSAIPGRVALLVTLFLVLVTLFANVMNNTPKAKGMTALTVYILVCIMYVVSAKLVFAFNLFVHRQSKTPKQLEEENGGKKKKKKKNKGEEKDPDAVSAWEPEEKLVEEGGEEGKKDMCGPIARFFGGPERYAQKIEDKHAHSRRVDRNAFIVFSSSFVFFNLIYLTIFNTRPIAGGPYD